MNPNAGSIFWPRNWGPGARASIASWSIGHCVFCVCSDGMEQAKSQVSLASTNQLSISVTETDLSNLTASIKRPSGQEEPCGLKRLPSGQLGEPIDLQLTL